MQGTERRLHVYHNGSHTVVKLSETRLSSSPPGGLSSVLSRLTPPHLERTQHTKTLLVDDWDAEAPSTLNNSTALGSDERRRPSLEAAEDHASSPPPRAPLPPPNAGQQPRAAVLSPWPEAEDGSGKGGVAAHSGSCPGVSPSPPLWPTASLTASTAAPSVLSDHPLSWGSAPAAATLNERAGDVPTPQEMGSDGPRTQSVLVSCDASCIAQSPPPEPPQAMVDNSGHRALTETLNEPARDDDEDGRCSGSAVGRDGQRASSRRSGEVTVAERVLLFDEVDEEDAEEVSASYTTAMERESFIAGLRAAASSAVNASTAPASAATPPRLSCSDLRQPLDGKDATFSLETFTAHTPPRVAGAAAAAASGAGVSPVAAASSTDASGQGSGISTISCTCTPGDAPVVRDGHSTSHTSAVLDSVLLSQHPVQQQQQQQQSRLSNASASTRDTTALSTTALNKSAVADSYSFESGHGTVDSRPCAASEVLEKRERLVDSDSTVGGVEDNPHRSLNDPPAVEKVLPDCLDRKDESPDLATVSTSTEKTPTPSPHRHELLYRLLTHAAASALRTPHSPANSTASAAASTSAAAAASATTPLHTPTSHLLRRFDAAHTPCWEGMARFTGFPTPVKLSPLPTKGYDALYSELAASATAGGGAAATPRSNTASDDNADEKKEGAGSSVCLLLSPTVSAINSEEGDGDGAVVPTAWNSNAGAPVAPSGHGAPRSSESSVEGKEGSVTAVMSRLSDTNGAAQSVAAGAESAHRSSASECSVSPIRAAAGQTTRVWTPQQSEASQGQLLPIASLSGLTLTSDAVRCPTVPAALQRSAVVPSPVGSVTGAARSGPAIPQYHSATAPQSDTFLCSSAPADESGNTAQRNAAPGSEKKGQEEGERDALTAVSLRPQSPPPLPHSPLASSGRHGVSSIDAPRCRRASRSIPGDLPLTGRSSPRLVADTLNLGTPTLSMIHSPAQATNESCSFLLLPSAAPQYIQALPVPGMGGVSCRRKEDAPRRTASRPQWHVDEEVMADELCLCLEVPQGRAVHARVPLLLSPAADDGDATLTTTTGAMGRRHRDSLLSPFFGDHVEEAPPPRQERHGQATQTCCSAAVAYTAAVKEAETTVREAPAVPLRSCASCQTSGNFIAQKAGGFNGVSTSSSNGQSPSPLSSSTTVTHLSYRRSEMSSRVKTLSDGAATNALGGVASPFSVTQPLSSTRFLDTWL